MLTITAVIKVKSGSEETMRKALLDVAEYVRANEPGTIGFYISQDEKDPAMFTTYERFVDQAAMDAHNNSASAARFYKLAQPLFDGDIVLIKAIEISKKA